MSRTTTRIFLGLSLILAIGVAVFSLNAIQSPSDAAWATLAAALAVITSMISAFSAQRIVELEEDKLRPHPYPHFDTTSRFGLVLFRVTNNGGSAAYNIILNWDTPLENSGGEKIRFSPERVTPEIPVLLPSQSVAKTVDGHVQFFGMTKKHEYSGYVEYNDTTGRKYKQKFLLDAEMFKNTPLYSEEELKTHYQLQQLPEELKKIRSDLSKIEKHLRKTPSDKDKDTVL